MTPLHPFSPVPDELTVVGKRWRELMGDLTFDRLVVDVVRDLRHR